MRETTIKLDNESAFGAGISAAIADKHSITRVRISLPLHNMIAWIGNHNKVDADPVLRNFRNNYDFVPKPALQHTELSGWMYGSEVFIDGHLEGHTLVVESEAYEQNLLH